jgi:hypothetical protein
VNRVVKRDERCNVHGSVAQFEKYSGMNFLSGGKSSNDRIERVGSNV